MIENVRLDAEDRQKLIGIKKATGIENWNTICRWAFCLSLSQDDPPPQITESKRDAIEMTWQTFGGSAHAIFFALVQVDHHKHGGKQELSDWFYRHLRRGILLLADVLKENASVSSMLNLAVTRSLLPNAG